MLLLAEYGQISLPLSKLRFPRSDLHAVQCCAGAAHTAGPEAALLGQGSVAPGQQLTAQPQVLPAQTWFIATLGILSEQLAAPADVLGAELWEGWRAVSIIPREGRDKTYADLLTNDYVYTVLHRAGVMMTLSEHIAASYLASTANTCCQTAAIPQAL